MALSSWTDLKMNWLRVAGFVVEIVLKSLVEIALNDCRNRSEFLVFSKFALTARLWPPVSGWRRRDAHTDILQGDQASASI